MEKRAVWGPAAQRALAEEGAERAWGGVGMGVGDGGPRSPGGRGGQERWRAPLRKVGLWDRDGAVAGGFSDQAGHSGAGWE